tara:strand:+ start:195 stop:935 length:741 start_codon:yes stop_codon:yes gene_type:complete
MIYLHKILPLIASPLFLVFFLILFGAFLRSKKITFFGLLVLFFCSLPVISNNLITYLEKDYTPQDASSINETDAIVVLSGMVTAIKTGETFKYEFGDGVDRVLSGMDLLNNNKAPLLIFTRGKLPWQLGLPEGEYLKEFAIKYGIPEEKILLTDNVQNTDEEAKSVKRLLNTNDAEIILVTSAFHMPRAKKVFEAANIRIIPFAVDFNRSTKKTTLMDFIPTARSLSETSFFVREMIGRLYYSLKY